MIKKKESKKIIWIVGIIIVVLLLFNYYQKPKEGIGLQVHYYKDGVEVFPEKSLKSWFSVVTEASPGQSYDTISFSISGTNTGNTDLTNVTIINATPLAFKNALPITNQVLLKGEHKILWDSDNISIAQFEGMPQPVRFWYNVSAGTGILKNYSQGYIDLIISGEGLVIFRTNVKQYLNEHPWSPYYVYQSTQDDLDKTTDGKLKWIAFDKDRDRVMEKYGVYSSTTGVDRTCDSPQLSYGVLLYMPFGHYVCSLGNEQYCDVWILNNSQTNRIGLCYTTSTIGTGASSIRWWQTNAAGAENAIITNESIQPYVLNRQERYR